MINDASIEAVRNARIGHGRTLPLYGSYSFSRIPGSAYRLLSGNEGADFPSLPTDAVPEDGLRHVVFVLIDGLGWDKIESVLGSGFAGVARFERDGVVSYFTSRFPSTTADHHLALDQRGRTTW